MEILIFVLALSIGFHAGWYGKEILNSVRELVHREPPVKTEIVTALPPDEADVTASSYVVSPKTPAQIEFEERERVRKLL